MVEISATVLAPNDPMGVGTTVTMKQRTEVLASGWIPAIAPAPHRHQDIEKVLPFGSEDVLESRRTLLVLPGGKDVVFAEEGQPLTEDVPSDSEILLELVESAHSHEGVAQDQDGPAVADQLSGVGHRASEVFETLAGRHR
jgi:hypothetical protein